MADRAAFYVDGFNLYHAIAELNEPHLKWLDLWSLGNLLIPSHSETLVRVVYCSAFATHMPERMVRHRKYVAALKSNGVDCVMGTFKKKSLTRCHGCQRTWQNHEEKESDVNIAIHLLDDAHMNEFDHAYLVTADSDLAAVTKMFRRRFPNKKITSVSPPNRRHAGAIAQNAHGKIALKKTQLERCLFPVRVIGSNGKLITERPAEYEPPNNPNF